jgi:MSHA biogenesis protein MshI
MKFIKNILKTKFFASRLNDTTNQGIIGVSTTAYNITMANIKGTSPESITVDSYRCVAVNSRQEQINALKEYVEEYKLINCDCSYVLPLDKYVIGIIESPSPVETDIPETVRLAVKDFVDYPIEEAVVDLFSLPFKRIDDNKDVSYAVVVHSSVITETTALINEAGLKLKYIDIHELCLRNLAMLHEGSKKGTLLLRLYANGGHIVLVRGNTVFMTRRLDLPLKDLLIGAVSIPQWQQQTEQQKNNILLDTLTLDLQRSMDYCSSIFRQSPINCVILTPTELEIDNINDFLTKHLGMATHTLNLPDLMCFKQDISKADQAKCLLAIGAGLRNIKVESYESTDKSVSN